MKYRAPEGVTALSCAGESIAPNEVGHFEAAERFAAELAAHGCVAVPAPEGAAEKPARGRARERAN